MAKKNETELYVEKVLRLARRMKDATKLRPLLHQVTEHLLGASKVIAEVTKEIKAKNAEIKELNDQMKEDETYYENALTRIKELDKTVEELTEKLSKDTEAPKKTAKKKVAKAK